MSGLSALRRSGRFMVMVSRPLSRFCRTISFALMVSTFVVIGFNFYRHCEERSDEAIQLCCFVKAGLLRFARNDGRGVQFDFFTSGQRDSSSGWNASLPATVPISL